MEEKLFENYLCSALFGNQYNAQNIQDIIELLVISRESGNSIIPLIVSGKGFLVDPLWFCDVDENENIGDLIKKSNYILSNENFIEIIEGSQFLKIDKLNGFLAFSGDLNLEKEILSLIKSRSDSYSKEQKKDSEDIYSVIDSSISILKGGPGSGKTYSCTKIVERILSENNKARIGIAAPTGKAVDVIRSYILNNITSEDFRERIQFDTVHSLFSIKVGFSEVININKQGFDFILIDESSMLSTKSMWQILCSLSSFTKIVFIGDENQLPPVDCGAIFPAICKLKNIINIVTLKGNKRASNKDIVYISENIMKQEKLDCILEGDKDLLLKFLEKKINDMDLNRYLLFEDTLSKKNAVHLCALIDEYKCLTVSNTGIFGSIFINEYIENKISYLAKKIGAAGYVSPCISTVNQKSLGISNGTHMLRVKYFDFDLQNLYIYMNESNIVFVEEGSIRGVELSWALSVHKSQGSSYKNVLVFIGIAKSCTKMHLYTAATRAQENVGIYIFNRKPEKVKLINEIYKRSGFRASSLEYMKD